MNRSMRRAIAFVVLGGAAAALFFSGLLARAIEALQQFRLP